MSTERNTFLSEEAWKHKQSSLHSAADIQFLRPVPGVPLSHGVMNFGEKDDRPARGVKRPLPSFQPALLGVPSDDQISLEGATYIPFVGAEMGLGPSGRFPVLPPSRTLQGPGFLSSRSPAHSWPPNLSLDGPAYEPSVGTEMRGLSDSPQAIQSVRCITADRALSHVSTSMEGLLLEVLTRVQYKGLYRIRVGFNEAMLKEGLQVEEIYVTLEDNLKRMSDSAVCSMFEPIFAPFPGIVSTPNQVHYIRIDNQSPAISSSKDLQPATGRSPNKHGKGNRKNGEGSDGREGRRAWEDEENGGSEGGEGDIGSGGPGYDSSTGGGGGIDGKTNRRKGRRVLVIAGFGSTMTIRGPKGSDQVKVTGSLDIIVRNSL